MNTQNNTNELISQVAAERLLGQLMSASEKLGSTVEYIHHLENERSHLEAQNRLLAKELADLHQRIANLAETGLNSEFGDAKHAALVAIYEEVGE
jgi:predicted nuclease with TOPRIM domain